MADPTIQTFCCHRINETSGSERILLEFNSDEYNIVCSISSCIGILGAIYQLLPREELHTTQRWMTFPITRGRQIITWLATADLLASLGVFVRSILWLNIKQLVPTGSTLSSTLFCSITSAWVQYFYMATWLWTLCYAIDIKLVLKERNGAPALYHLVAWTLPATLTGVGLSILYVPNANCHSLGSNAYIRILPNYCATYLPIAVVMIANPLLYSSSSRDVQLIAVRALGQFTSKERAVVDALRLKFFAINAAFYMCWLPNLINGILLWTLWFNLPVKVITSLWYIMAVTNPLQALFNSIVYRKWKGQPQRLYIPCRSPRTKETHSSSNSGLLPTSLHENSLTGVPDEANEGTPLLRSEELRSHQNTSINGCTAT